MAYNEMLEKHIRQFSDAKRSQHEAKRMIIGETTPIYRS